MYDVCILQSGGKNIKYFITMHGNAIVNSKYIHITK